MLASIAASFGHRLSEFSGAAAADLIHDALGPVRGLKDRKIRRSRTWICEEPAEPIASAKGTKREHHSNLNESRYWFEGRMQGH